MLTASHSRTGARRIFSAAMTLAVISIITISVLGLPAHAGKNYTYPEARKADVTDDYHGTMVKDPYRWMEDPEAEETTTWVEAQNKLFQSFIESEQSREVIEKRIISVRPPGWANTPRWSR